MMDSNKFFDDEISITVCDDSIKQDMTDGNKFKSIEFNISQLADGSKTEYEVILPGKMYYNRDTVDILLHAGGHLPDKVKTGLKSAYISSMKDCIGLSDHAVTYTHYDSEKNQYILDKDIVIHLGAELKKIRASQSNNRYSRVNKNNLIPLLRCFKYHILPLNPEEILSCSKQLLRTPFKDRYEMAELISDVGFDCFNCGKPAIKPKVMDGRGGKHPVKNNPVAVKALTADAIEKALNSDKHPVELVLGRDRKQRVVEIDSKEPTVKDKEQSKINIDFNDKSKGLWAEVNGITVRVDRVCRDGNVVYCNNNLLGHPDSLTYNGNPAISTCIIDDHLNILMNDLSVIKTDSYI